jgi:hypothetical protein
VKTRKIDDQDAGERVFKIHKPIRDLLHAEIDYSQNILGNFFLERGHYTVIAAQVASENRSPSRWPSRWRLDCMSFGMPTPGSLRVVLVQAEDSNNDLKRSNQLSEVMNSSLLPYSKYL